MPTVTPTPTLDPAIKSHLVHLEDVDFNLHYLETNSLEINSLETNSVETNSLEANNDKPEDEVILLVHGWPTSSFLYRHMMAPLAKHHRVIAIDLPGFGQSDKRPQDSFSFKYHANIIQAFIDKLKIKKVHLVVHDLGGPIALWWAQKNPQLIKSYVFLDTVIYPDFSWAVKLFVLMTVLPLVRTWFSSPRGIRFAMRLGLVNKSKLTPEVLRGYQDPFYGTANDNAARKALLRSAHKLHIHGFKDIAKNLESIKQPTCLIYAEKDIILPEIATTMARVKKAIPHATLHSIPDCGHFLQEEKPAEVVKFMSEFYQNI